MLAGLAFACEYELVEDRAHALGALDRNGITRRRPARPLSTTSINKTITRLAQILEVAVEYGLIAANPAKGRRRRLKPSKPAPVWLDAAEQIEALLDAAAELDERGLRVGGHDHKGGLVYRRALLATLVFAGLRICELTALRWSDVDLASSRLFVRESKTDAGIRRVEILPALLDVLSAHKARTRDPRSDVFVFTTAAGTELKQSNVRRRVLAPTVARANRKLSEGGGLPLPKGLTPHKLRHRPGVGDGPARAHRSRLHAACVSPCDAARLWRARTAAGSDRPRGSANGRTCS